MTTVQELINQIETVAFEVQFTVINNFKILQKALAQNEIIGRVIEAIQEDRQDAELVFERIRFLIDDKPEAGFMHTHDIQILAYLYALNATQYLSLTLSTIEKIRETTGFYWASKYAEHIEVVQEKPSETN